MWVLRAALALAAMLCGGGALTIGGFRIASELASARTAEMKAFRISVTAALALIVAAIFAAGVFAAIPWELWLYPIIRTLRTLG